MCLCIYSFCVRFKKPAVGGPKLLAGSPGCFFFFFFGGLLCYLMNTRYMFHQPVRFMMVLSKSRLARGWFRSFCWAQWEFAVHNGESAKNVRGRVHRGAYKRNMYVEISTMKWGGVISLY